LIVIKKDPALAELFPEDLILRQQVLDDLLVLTVDPC
jgi:hypothetical protein